MQVSGIMEFLCGYIAYYNCQRLIQACMVLINIKIPNYTMFLLEFQEELLYILIIWITYCFHTILSDSSFRENSKTRTGITAYRKTGFGGILFCN
jgi:hypothetical protein